MVPYLLLVVAGTLKNDEFGFFNESGSFVPPMKIWYQVSAHNEVKLIIIGLVLLHKLLK